MLLGLSTFEFDLLDLYAGAGYRRSAIAVMIDEELHEADAYRPVTRMARDAQTWSLFRWQQKHKARMLVAAGLTAAELRARLIAIRPN